LKAIVRNACPFKEATIDNCAPNYTSCSTSQELNWNYTYYTDTDNMPVKIQTIDATPTNNFQSMKYEYYPDWSLQFIWRKDRNGGYNKISEFTYYSDGSVHTSKDALEKVTEYWYYNEEADQVKNGKLKKVSYPANNDSLVKPTYYYSYCFDCADPDNPNDPHHFSGELIYTQKNPDILQSSYYYDILERLEKTHLPNPGNNATGFSTTIAYDQPDGVLRCSDSTDANGKVSRSCYDQHGNLIKQIQDYGQTDITTLYTYQNGLLASITDANGYTTSYGYDDINRLIGIDYPDTSSDTACPDRSPNYDACYYYYNNGMLKKKMDTKRQSIRFEYDELGRLLHKYYGATGTSGISYSYLGQMLLSVTDNRQSRTTSYTYDANYRTANVTTAEGTLNYFYDNNDRLTSYQIPSAKAVSYSYYDDGSVKQISRGSSKNISYTYRLAGQRDTMTLPFLSTRAIQYDYNLQGRLTQIQNYKKAQGSPVSLSTYSYTYDFDHPEYPEDPEAIWKGYRTGMDETVSTSPPANRTEKYYYDSLYQLIKSDYSGDLTDIFQWSYDSIGNRIQQTTSNPSSTTNYTYYQLEPGYNSQLLRHDGSKCYIWDLNGNLSCTYPKATVEECPAVDEPHEESSCPSSPLDAAGKALYSWDEDDRLVDLKWYDTSERHAQYFYDFNGNRYQKTVGSTTTTYLYHNEDIVKSGSKYYIHSPGIDEPAFICPNDSCANLYYYFADDLGSIRQIIDDANSSNIENLYRYGSWGELTSPFSKSESISNPYAYTSREFAENGAYYYRWRYYQSDLARFISKDIVINKFSNAFSYAKNNSLLYIDPYGTQEIIHGCHYTAWIPVSEKDIVFSKCREKSRRITKTNWKCISNQPIPQMGLCLCWWEKSGCEGVIRLWCNIACYRKVVANGCSEKECPGPLQRQGCELEKDEKKLSCTVDSDKRVMTTGRGQTPCSACPEPII